MVSYSPIHSHCSRLNGERTLPGRAMRKVAVFGNAGGGKSGLARRLAEITGLPLYSLDIIQFRQGRYWPEEQNGGKVSDEEYEHLHRDILTAFRASRRCRKIDADNRMISAHVVTDPMRPGAGANFSGKSVSCRRSVAGCFRS